MVTHSHDENSVSVFWVCSFLPRTAVVETNHIVSTTSREDTWDFSKRASALGCKEGTKTEEGSRSLV